MEQNKFTIAELYKSHTMSETADVFDLVDNIIDNLDEYAIKELCEGYSYDIDKLFLDILKESNDIINSGSSAKSFSFNYLESLTDNLDFYLKDLSLAYFVSNSLPSFNIETYHLEWFNLIQIYRFLVVLAARGHSKSYTFSFCYILWMMYKYKGGRTKKGNGLVLISSEKGLSTNFIGLIKTEIENNPLLKDKIFPISGKGTWAKEYVETKNGFTLLGRGIESSLRGLHYDVLCDDLLSEGDFYNSAIRQNTIEVFNNVIMSIPLPKTGKVTVVGTPFAENDLYGYLKKTKNFRVFEYPAIYPDGHLLSPERFSLDELIDKKYQIGSLSFSREYLMKPISNQVSLFPLKLLKLSLFGGYEMFSNRFNIPSDLNITKITFGVDLAVAANTDNTEDSDYFCVAIIGKDDLNRYWILNIYRERGLTYSQQIDIVKRLEDAFSPESIRVENNQYQKVFSDLLRDAGVKNVTDGATTEKNKYSFSIGIPAVAVLFEQLRIKIPYYDKDIYTKNLAELIIAEFNSMTFNKNKLQATNGHDDIPMAVWLGITAQNYINDEITVSFLTN